VTPGPYPTPSPPVHNGPAPPLCPHRPCSPARDPRPPSSRCAGRFPFPVCQPYGFLSHFTVLLWLQDSQGAELALIDWLDFTRGS
jgi:hypothetical protein